MSKTTSVLYECRGCGGAVASKQLSCPYCGKSKGPTGEKNAIGGGVEEYEKAWYRTIDLKTD